MMGRKILVAFAAAAFLCGGGAADAAENPSAEEVRTSPESSTVSVLPYAYDSAAYGYRIMCPQKPAGVIPASALFENREGEVLIFDHEDYYIKYAWVVLVNAFPEDALPNLNTIRPDEAVDLLQRIMGSNGYEGIVLANLSEGHRAIFATTAKDVEIDEDGDGTPDATAKADQQMAVLFFRSENGQRYGLELIDNPDLRPTSVSALLAGARTLQELQ